MLKNIRYTCGLTFIEFLIALSLSGLLLKSILFIYITAEKNQQMQAAVNSIQENAYSAAQLFQTELPLAGNIGCAKLQKNFLIKSHVLPTLTEENKIFVIDNKLTIRGASVESAKLINPMPTDKMLWVTPTPRFQAGQILLVENCQHAELFTAQSVIHSKDRQKIVVQQPLLYSYDANAELHFFVNNTYFIDQTNRQQINGKPIYALYLQRFEGSKIERIEGVTAMNLQFDVLEAGEIRTLAPENISDWSKVVAVKINLMLEALNGYFLNKKWLIYVAL